MNDHRSLGGRGGGGRDGITAHLALLLALGLALVYGLLLGDARLSALLLALGLTLLLLLDGDRDVDLVDLGGGGGGGRGDCRGAAGRLTLLLALRLTLSSGRLLLGARLLASLLASGLALLLLGLLRSTVT